MKFNDEYKKIKELCTNELIKTEQSMYESISVKEPLQSYILDFLKSPSKRIRPVLCILYLKALGINITVKHYELFAGVELIHNASLIHDDIIDESDLRRGMKTISSEFGNKLGVVAGDYILSVAMEKIISLNNIGILLKFIQTIKKMCIGEINQNFDRFKIGTIENYIEKSKNKTAYLFETALLSSLMLCNNDYNSEKASDFALNFGIAFQIRDDLLNLSQTDSTKPVKNDITEGIYNAAVIYAQSVENYEEGIEKHSDLLNNYIQKAQSSLSVLKDNIYAQALMKFSELLKNG